MIDMLLLAVMVVAALLIMFPAKWRRKLMGYSVACDVIASSFIVSTYAATGTASGLTVAVAAALLLSITFRLLRHIDGYEIYSINGETRVAVVAAALITQGVKWVRSIVKSLWNGGVVTAPEPLGGQWISQKDQWSWRLV